jgi:hypothetical protein
MKSYQKQLAIELIDEYVKKNCEHIYFVDLLTELTVFGNKNTDRVMAFGITLIHDADNLRTVKTQEEEEKSLGLSLVHFKNDNGRIVPINELQNENNFNSNKRFSTFGF